jgi:hypothetical protein
VLLGCWRLPPSPPEKATARQDQARQSSTGDGAGDGDGCRSYHLVPNFTLASHIIQV